MITMKFKLTGQSPIGFSKAVQTKKERGEAHDVFEERVWREKMHTTEKGDVFIPPSAIKNMLVDCARYLSEQVPGKGKATYTKHMEAGVLVTEPILIGVKAKDVEPLKMFVPSDGKRGGGSRVWKHFPVIQKWGGVAEVMVLDPLLIGHYEKVWDYMESGGQFIGLGWFRPRNNGWYGRFTVECLTHKRRAEYS
jgi:hypothetical protein